MYTNMTSRYLALSIICLTFVLPTTVNANEVSAPALTPQALASHVLSHHACNDLTQLSWLVGAWQHQANNQRVTEHWQQTANGEYQGVGQFINLKSANASDTIDIEQLRIVLMDNQIFYLAKPASSELPVPFKLVNCTDNHWEFINANHDFPQRLHYQLVSDNQLTVEVTDLSGKGFTLQFFKQPLSTRHEFR
ncbi:DUF6265 family protein [Colwellia sp. MEBiC06753]